MSAQNIHKKRYNKRKLTGRIGTSTSSYDSSSIESASCTIGFVRGGNEGNFCVECETGFKTDLFGATL